MDTSVIVFFLVVCSVYIAPVWLAVRSALTNQYLAVLSAFFLCLLPIYIWSADLLTIFDLQPGWITGHVLALTVGTVIILVTAYVEKRSFVFPTVPKATLSVIASILQQIVYFVVLLPVAIATLGLLPGLCLTTALFVYLHTMTNAGKTGYFLTLVAGIGFCLLHVYTPAPLATMALHALLNSLTVNLGFLDNE